MKRLLTPALFALLTFSLAAPGCAGKIPEIWPALKACGANDVSWAAATEVFGDLVEVVAGNPAGEADLLALLANDVGGGIPCLVNYFETQGGSTGAAATKFKAAHAKELSAAAARGPSACRSPGDSTPKTGPTAAVNQIPKAEGGNTSRTGAVAISVRESVSAAAPVRAAVASGDSASRAKPTLASCDVVCGGPKRSLAPPSGCLCHVGAGMSARWVAAR